MSKKVYDKTKVSMFPDDLKMELPDGYRIDIEYDDDFNEVPHLRGGFYINDEGEEDFDFTCGFLILNNNVEDRDEMVKQGKLKETFVPGLMLEQVAKSVMESQEQNLGPGTRYNLYNSYPAATIMKFNNSVSFLGIPLDVYILMCWIEIREDMAFGINTSFTGDYAESGQFYANLIDVLKSVRVKGKAIDLGSLTPDELKSALDSDEGENGEGFDLLGGMFDSAGFDFENILNPTDAVRFDDNDERKVIVDDKWSFVLPEGLELYFDSDHVGIMGEDTTANYVIKGANYNGRYMFDFELYERTDIGIGSDTDVIGCRYDNAVSTGDARQKILIDGDDLYVDIVGKPIIIFRQMVSVRVRGENIRPWDFAMGLDGNDEELAANWDEVKDLYVKLAESIELLDSGDRGGKGNEKKKKAKKKKETSDPNFVVVDGVLRRYIGKDKDTVIPAGIKEIADSSFSGRSDIKSVVVPDGVKRIGNRSFENCTNMERIDLPDSVEEIGEYAFVDCHKLKKIHLSDKIKFIGGSTFSECFELGDVNIPSGIKEIGSFTFKNCDRFKQAVIPEGVTKIGVLSFSDCDSLEHLFIPKTVTDIEIDFMNQHPFTGSKKLTILTPAGSYAQQFAAEQGIPYENAGEVKPKKSDGKEKKSLKRKISYRENEIKKLSAELEELEAIGDDKEKKAEYIEGILKDSYYKTPGLHPADWSLEPEIEEVAKETDKEFRRLKKEYESETGEIFDVLETEVYNSLFDPEVELQVGKLKRIVKKYIKDLTRVLGHLNDSTNYFEERGIPASALKKLIDIMEAIHEEGKKIEIKLNDVPMVYEYMPFEYETIISAWKRYYESMPDDTEERARQDKASAGENILQKLRNIEKQYEETKERIESIEAESRKIAVELPEMEKELGELLDNYDEEIARREEEPQKRLNTLRHKLTEIRKRREEKIREKRELQETLEQTIAIAFGKKRQCKEGIEAAGAEILQLEHDEEDTENKIREEKTKMEKMIKALNVKILDLKSKIEQSRASAENNPGIIAKLKNDLEVQEKELAEAKKEVADFRVNYLVNNHPDIIRGITGQISEKRSRLEKLTRELEQFTEELKKMNA